MSEVDNTPALSPRKLRATDLRLVFYIWPEIECAFTIRGLAQFMSAPTERSWDDAQTPMFQADFANVWSRTCPPLVVQDFVDPADGDSWNHVPFQRSATMLTWVRRNCQGTECSF